MKRIFLVGYMCAGKTTLGKALARELELKFIDIDWYIEQRYHATIRELFAQYGEEEFRRIEQRMLHEVAEFENVLIATGGGTPCFFDNMDYMNRMGDTVFLEVSHDMLFQRLKAGKQSRPILMHKSDQELEEFVQEALQHRLPYYEKAQHRFSGDDLESTPLITASVAAIREILRI